VSSPTDAPHWRIAESRRLIDDARSLLSSAEALREWDTGSGPRAPPTSGAVLVHALILDEPAASGPMPVLVLLGDAPSSTLFLPTETDPADPSEDGVRAAIERTIRGALGQPPPDHHAIDLIESIQDAVLVIDRRQDLTYLNPSATALLQTLTSRTGPFLGQPLATAFPPAASAAVLPAIQAALVDAETSRVTDPARHHGLALDIAIFPTPHGATLLVRDVSERKDLEAELSSTRASLARAVAQLEERDAKGTA